MRNMEGSRFLRTTFILVAAVCLVAASCSDDGGASTPGATSSGSGERPRVAALFTQFVDQGNWDPAGYEAYQNMCEKYDFDCTYVEEASYEEAPGLLRDFGSDGYDMVITHSSGYSAAIEEVAPDYPDTEFVLFSFALDTKGLDNYSAWSMNWDQHGYMIGTLAALASSTNKIGVVAGEDIPSFARTLEVLQTAAEDARPGIEVEIAYVGSWIDAAKAKEIALAQVNDGVGFLIPQADTASAGVKQAAEETGTLTLGEYIDEGPQYPEAIVTSQIVDMNSAFDEMGQNFVDGTLNGQIVQMGAETGDLQYTTPFQNVDPEIEAQVLDILSQLEDGSLVVSIDE
jgi:basic membrane protein A